MEINVDAKLKYVHANSSFVGDELVLIIKYKLPYRKLKTREKIWLCYEFWERYNGSYEKFQDDVILHIKNRDRIESRVNAKVTNRIKDDIADEGINKKYEEIQKLLKENKNLTFKVNFK